MQRWIKKKKYRLKHAKRPDVEELHLPVQKKVKITPWQKFIKNLERVKVRIGGVATTISLPHMHACRWKDSHEQWGDSV